MIKTYCERCKEKLKWGSDLPSESIAEIVDKDGNVLIVHQDCMIDTDTVA